ncbi:hypothetical protein ACJMK2_031602 [Sinanodonta woodiana]|uniref:Mitochondria-eating protein C-terminal domain-containing protein n=1 Tax=Sinanodonta woodiana TaxID=1069815 RepID=A0ABD3X0Q6_SINWO
MNRTVTQEKHIIADLEKRVQRLELERERALNVNKQQQCDIEKLEHTYYIIYLENGQLEKSLNDMTRNLSQGAKIISDLQQRTESLVLERESILAVNIQLQSDIETLNKMYSNSLWKNGQLEKSLKEMGRTLSQEKETVSDLQNRLSKLAGDLLTHENTNITDLSDPNRPIKLSETYSEIYDNEWTDAFEELTGRGLTDILAIKKLRDMLLCSLRKCRDVTWARYQTLKSTMSTVDICEVLPSAKDFTESEEKSESSSNESKVTSSKETHNTIPINSEAHNKESEEKSESSSNELKVTSSKETHNSIPINSEAHNKESVETSESSSNESEVTSSTQTDNRISINLEAHNKESVETSESSSNESEVTSSTQTDNRISINLEAHNKESVETSESSSNESEVTSSTQTDNRISINLEAHNKESVETSESSSNESEVTSSTQTDNRISINLEAHNKESVETSESSSNESEVTSSTQTDNRISINLEAHNKEDDKTETNYDKCDHSLRNETYHSISINFKAQNKEETCRDSCVSSASREAELLYQRNIEGERTSQSKKEHLTCTIALTVEQEKEIKRIWRTTTNALMDESVRNLHILLLTKFDISIEDWPNTSKYLARCIDLCWKMGVQEKPMYLDACDEKSDCCEKIFNHDKYRAYMQTGKRVEFVVWPALFLHEGGAMLVKGIAQGCQ